MRLFEVFKPLLESQARIEALAAKYGDALDRAMRQDVTIDQMSWPAMSGDFNDWVVEEFVDDSWEGEVDYLLRQGEVDINADYFDKKGFTEAIVEFFANNFDPTPNKQYLDWILRAYVSERQFFIEDGELVQDVLATFHQFKRHLPEKDINQYKSFSSLREAIKPFEGEISDTLKQEVIGTGEAEVLYQVGDERLVHVKTLKASKAFGKGTEWCTQYPNMFDQYNRQGPIYIIDTPHPDDRIQIHFESGQIMDVYDNPVIPHKEVNVLKMHPTYAQLIEKKKREAEAVASGLREFDDIEDYIHKVFEFGASIEWLTKMYTERLDPKIFQREYRNLIGMVEVDHCTRINHPLDTLISQDQLNTFISAMHGRSEEIAWEQRIRPLE